MGHTHRGMALTTLRRRMREDLQRRGLAPNTPPCSFAAVHHLAPYYRRPPDQLSEAALRQFFLSWLNAQTVAERTCRIHLYGIRFFDELTRKRPWPVFDRVRPRHLQKLPVVFSPREGRDLLAVVKHPTARMCLRLISAGGLRLREGTQRQISDIDAQRMLVRVRQGPGGKDRYVPLADRTRQRLREYWQRGRSHPWWFPARPRPTSLSPTALHQTFTAVVRQSSLAQDASIPTLRHSSATHLWARGVSLRVSPARLGHQRPRTTAR